MREIHGVMAKIYETDEMQRVHITDLTDGISLYHTHTHTKAAVLDVDEALFLAKQLVLAARRLRERLK